MALEGFNTKLVGSVFADNELFENGLDPLCMVQLAQDGECDGFLIDTLTKDGRNLFDFMSEDVLKDIVLKGKINKIGPYPFGFNPPIVMGISARGSFKRSDFGMMYAVKKNLVGDTIDLIIELEARRN